MYQNKKQTEHFLEIKDFKILNNKRLDYEEI